MSLFKTREWWSMVVGQDEEFDLGCLCVADVDNKDKERVIVGSLNGCLRIFQPSKSEGGGMRPDHVICEVQLSAPILQIESGRFVSGTGSHFIAVLHPRKLSVYGLSVQSGVTEIGTQYQLRCQYEHKLQRAAYNFCYGAFGGVKVKDLICVQSMDGTVSIFEQETFAFSRFLPGALIPGPIKYLLQTDSFITVATSRQVESYKLQTLATATDTKDSETQNLTTGKRVTADWTFLINEPAIDVVITNFSGSQTTIFVLGERNLYALTESGQLNFMKKFDFNPSCFLPYAAVTTAQSTGRAGEGGGTVGSVCYLVATHSRSLRLYQGVTLKWAAQLPHVPVQVKVADIGDVRGTIVALDECGHLSCFYLGTDPSMFSRPPIETRELDYQRTQTEMVTLNKAIAEQQHKLTLPTPTTSTEDELKVSVSVSTSLDRPSFAVDSELKDDEPIPSITALVSLTSKVTLHNVRLNVNVRPPLTSSITSLTFSTIDSQHPTETRVTFYMKQRLLPTDMKASITATYYTTGGAPRVIRSNMRLPLTLVLRQCMPVKNAVYKLTIDTNKQAVNLVDIFTDLLTDKSSQESTSNVVGFKYYGFENVITILASKNAQRYRVQADEFSYMSHMLVEVVQRVSSYFRAGVGSDFKMTFDGSQLPLADYFAAIDRHFECRNKLAELTKLLEDHAAQFRSVQKRLLTMFKDKTPAPLKNLDALLDNTYAQIIAMADTIEGNKREQAELSAELCATTRIICLLVKLWQDLSNEDYSLLMSVLAANDIDGSVQGWEELAETATTNLLRTTLSKSNKDPPPLLGNATVMTPIKDIEKLKKHIALVCERVGRGGKITTMDGSFTSSGSAVTKQPSERTNHVTDNNQNGGKSRQKVPPLTNQEDFYNSPGTNEGKLKKIAAPRKQVVPSLESDLFSTNNEDDRKGEGERGDREEAAEVGYEERDSRQERTELGDSLNKGTSEERSGQNFLKKKKPVTSVPDLDALAGDNDDSDALRIGHEKLVYGL